MNHLHLYFKNAIQNVRFSSTCAEYKDSCKFIGK